MLYFAYQYSFWCLIIGKILSTSFLSLSILNNSAFISFSLCGLPRQSAFFTFLTASSNDSANDSLLPRLWYKARWALVLIPEGRSSRVILLTFFDNSAIFFKYSS